MRESPFRSSQGRIELPYLFQEKLTCKPKFIIVTKIYCKNVQIHIFPKRENKDSLMLLITAP